jgi:hypothetical protein
MFKPPALSYSNLGAPVRDEIPLEPADCESKIIAPDAGMINILAMLIVY